MYYILSGIAIASSHYYVLRVSTVSYKAIAHERGARLAPLTRVHDANASVKYVFYCQSFAKIEHLLYDYYWNYSSIAHSQRLFCE